jgi:hypothetical protein
MAGCRRDVQRQIRVCLLRPLIWQVSHNSLADSARALLIAGMVLGAFEVTWVRWLHGRSLLAIPLTCAQRMVL